MKSSRLRTSLCIILGIAIFIIAIDLASNFQGKNGYIIGKNRSQLLASSKDKKDDLVIALNEIKNTLSSLTSRLSTMEESIAKLNKEAKNKNNSLFKPTDSLMDTKSRIGVLASNSFDQSMPKKLKEIAQNKKINSYDNNDDIYYDHYHKPSKKWRKSHSYQNDINKSQNRFNESFKPSKNTDWSMRDDKYKHYWSDEESYQKPHSERRKSNFYPSENKWYNKRHDSPLRNSYETFKSPVFKVVPELPVIKKITAPGEAKKAIIYPNEFINLDEIFSNITKEKDPIVEVKRFDNFESFKNFAKNQADNNADINDDAVETNYFKMTDIIGTDNFMSGSNSKSAGLSKENVNDLKMLFEPKIHSNETNMSSSNGFGSSKKDSLLESKKQDILFNNIKNDLKDSYKKESSDSYKNDSFFDSPKKDSSYDGYKKDIKDSYKNNDSNASYKNNDSNDSYKKETSDSYKNNDLKDSYKKDSLFDNTKNESLFEKVKKDSKIDKIKAENVNNFINDLTNEGLNISKNSSNKPASLEDNLFDIIGTKINSDTTSKSDLPENNTSKPTETTIMKVFISGNFPINESAELSDSLKKDFENSKLRTLPFCEVFENPAEAFKNGKCGYKPSTIPNTLGYGIDGSLPLNTEEFINKIHATIKNMEDHVKSEKEVISDSPKSKNLVQDNIKINLKTDESNHSNLKENINNKTSLLTSSSKVLNDDEIQKPTTVQPSIN